MTEVSLDLDMVSAICPLCNIVVVEMDVDSNGVTSNPAQVADAAQAATNLAIATNASFGSCENESSMGLEAKYVHPGHVLVASSGDHGIFCSVDLISLPKFGVQFPASSPNVVAVGGTTLEHDNSDRGWHESVWNSFGLLRNTGTPGSGCSAFFPSPSGQPNLCGARRSVADISATAGPVAVYDSADGGWLQQFGTSVSAPIITAGYALAASQPVHRGQQRNQSPAGLYLVAGNPSMGTPLPNTTDFYDVVDGDNLLTGETCSPDPLCHATVGYDGPTGLGTLHALGALGGFPEAIASPTSLDFGNLAVGTSVEHAVELTNVGTAVLPYAQLSASLSGANSTDFSLSLDTCFSLGHLDPGDSCVLRVAFTPKSVGRRTASVFLPFSVARVQITGIGIPALPSPSATAQSSLPAAFVGSWSGTFNQTIPPIGSFQITMTLHGGSTGTEVGQGFYARDQLACRPTLTLQSSDAQSVTLAEHGLSPPCLGGTWTFQLSNQTLTGTWRTPSGQVGGNMTLTPSASALPDAYVGTWTGTFNQTVPQTGSFQMTMTLHAGALGTEVGQATYTHGQLACTPKLTLLRANGQAVALYELGLSSPCLGGTFTFQLTNQTLTGTWRTPSGQVGGTVTLTKAH